MRYARLQRQRGAIIVTVCLVMLFLLGFIGIALDFGKLFVVKSELQTAVDSCALAAAQELDSLPTAIDRARSAGLAAGNLNRVVFQSTDWSGKGQLVADEITFRDASYTVTTNPAVAQYAQCQHAQNGVQAWLLKALGAFTGNDTTFPLTNPVSANAVATRESSQSSCPLPLALKPKAGGNAANNYGFRSGEWAKLIMGAGASVHGEIGWANLDGSNDAAETEAELNGKCLGTKKDDHLGTPGVQASVADAWNYRFGIYKASGSPAPAKQNPDFSGYAYTDQNWPPDPADPRLRNAYYGTPYSDPTGTAENFATKRAKFASCDDAGTVMRGAPHSCESITGLSLNGFQKLATPGATALGGHHQYGRDRRTAIVPVVNDSMNVIDWSCMLMLQPLSIPLAAVDLEYIGPAGAPGSPCVTNGMPGGWAGPKVPQLVR